jgi:hypothetical protein
MHNYYKALKIEEEKKESERKAKLTSMLDKQSKKIQLKGYKSHENRVKNFNYDITIINNKVNDTIEYNKNLLVKRYMVKQRLSQPEAEKRITAGAFSKTNEEKLREWLFSNEVFKYINNQNKKTYLKSIESLLLGERSNPEIKSKNRKKSSNKNFHTSPDEIFLEYAKINPKPAELNPKVFKNPIKEVNENYEINEEEHNKERLLKLKSLFVSPDVRRRVSFIEEENNYAANNVYDTEEFDTNSVIKQSKNQKNNKKTAITMSILNNKKLNENTKLVMVGMTGANKNWLGKISL